MDEITKAICKSCEGYAAYYGDVRRQITSEYAADGRWVLASLFALNSGGLFGLLQIEEQSKLTVASAFSFWFGICAAFAVAIYSQRRTRAFNDAISGLERLYVLGAATGLLDEEEAESLENAKRAVSTKLAPFLTSASFLAFSLGLLTAALTV